MNGMKTYRTGDKIHVPKIVENPDPDSWKKGKVPGKGLGDYSLGLMKLD